MLASQILLFLRGYNERSCEIQPNRCGIRAKGQFGVGFGVFHFPIGPRRYNFSLRQIALRERETDPCTATFVVFGCRYRWDLPVPLAWCIRSCECTDERNLIFADIGLPEKTTLRA